jgi:hypothetical protein
MTSRTSAASTTSDGPTPQAPSALCAERSPALEAFLAHVVVDVSGCWLWRGERSRYGTYDGRAAHRASWELHQGKAIAPGLVVLHGCDVKGCVNPAHLRPGTARENARDAARAAERERARRRADEREREQRGRDARSEHWLTVSDDAQRIMDAIAKVRGVDHEDVFVEMWSEGFAAVVERAPEAERAAIHEAWTQSMEERRHA